MTSYSNRKVKETKVHDTHYKRLNCGQCQKFSRKGNSRIFGWPRDDLHHWWKPKHVIDRSGEQYTQGRVFDAFNAKTMITDLLGRYIDGRLIVKWRNGFGPLPSQFGVTGRRRCRSKPFVNVEFSRRQRSDCFGWREQKEPGHDHPGSAAAHELHGLACHKSAHCYT